jgi:hypothetical protein
LHFWTGLRARPKKEPLESGSGKFGRGCLKGTFPMRQGPDLRKCETGNYNCEKRNRSIEMLDIRQMLCGGKK